MHGIGVADAVRHSQYHSRVRRIAPALEVVATHPDDVRDITVTAAEELPIRVGSIRAVVLEYAQPTTGLDRVQHDGQAIRARHRKKAVDPREVLFIRSREIARRGEWPD